MKRLRTFRSYSGFGQWQSELEDEPVSWLARCQVAEIPSPYAYSPTVPIYRWGDLMVVSFEVSHRVFKVFEVNKELLRFDTDAKATDWHIRFRGQVAGSEVSR